MADNNIIVTDAESGEEYTFPDGTPAPDIQRAMVMRKMQRSVETAKGNIAKYPNAYSGATDKLRQTMPPADQDISDIRNPAAWKNAAGVMASGAPNAVMETIKGAFQRAKDISGATANQQLAESNLPFGQKLAQGAMNAVEQSPMSGVGLAKAIYSNAKYMGESAGKEDYVGAAIGAGSLLDPLGMGAPSIYENAKKNPGAGSVGYGLPDAAMALSPKIIEGVNRMANSLPEGAGMPKQMATVRLAQAIEPDPKVAPSVAKNLDAHIDSIMQQADKSGIPINNLSDLAKATTETAKADTYRSTFIEPFKDVRVTLYGGEETTVGKLDARLSEINDTLFPKFNKSGAGSLPAQASLGSEQAAGLMREAASIRHTLAEALSKQTGIPAAEIQAARARYGQINDLADKINQTVLDREYSKQVSANTPLLVKDLNPKNIPLNPKNWLGDIADRVVADTAKRYRAAAPSPMSEMNPPQPPPQRTPLWQGKTSPTEPPSASLNSLADILENQDRMRASLAARRKAAAESLGARNHNLNRHGKDY